MCYTTNTNHLRKVCGKCHGECQLKQVISSMVAKSAVTYFNKNIIENNPNSNSGFLPFALTSEVFKTSNV